MAKDTHRCRLLLRISPPYCIIPTVTFTMWQLKTWYFLVNSSCLYVLSCKFISRITLTFRFNLTSHPEYIALCGVSHQVINIIWGITHVWCFISHITLVVNSNLLCHTLSFVASLFKFWGLGYKEEGVTSEINKCDECHSDNEKLTWAWLGKWWEERCDHWD
jgi:hypothetical protein